MVTKCTNAHYIHDSTDSCIVHIGGKGVLEEAGVKQHNTTQAAPNELKLGEVG